jgi:hypothetical protein
MPKRGFGAMLDPKQSAQATNLSFEATPEASLPGGFSPCNAQQNYLARQLHLQRTYTFTSISTPE